MTLKSNQALTFSGWCQFLFEEVIDNGTQADVTLGTHRVPVHGMQDTDCLLHLIITDILLDDLHRAQLSSGHHTLTGNIQTKDIAVRMETSTGKK